MDGLSVQGIFGERLVIEGLVVSALTLLAAVLSPRLLRLLGRRSGSLWVSSFSQSLRFTLPLMVAFYGLFIIVELFTRKYAIVSHPEWVVQGRKLCLVGFLSWLALRWKEAFVASIGSSQLVSRVDKLDQSAILAISKLASICVLVLGLIMALDVIGVPVSTILAFGGIGGLAVSWAAKDVVANFFGGLMIYVTRPFAIGDWIRSDKGFEGVVEDIGWYRTQLRSLERRPTYIPNALITGAIVENPGRMYNRRIKTDLFLRHEDLPRITAITEKISRLLADHPELDHGQLRMVHFTEVTKDGLAVNILTFTKTTDNQRFREVQQDILLQAARIVHAEGAAFAVSSQRSSSPV